MPTMRMLIPEMDFSSSSWEASGAAIAFHHLLIHLLMTVYEHRLSMAMKMAPATHARSGFKPQFPCVRSGQGSNRQVSK